MCRNDDFRRIFSNFVGMEKRSLKIRRFVSTILLGALFATASAHTKGDGKLVILHTNDTHSRIDPDNDNLGGIARRQVVVDSIRASHSDVMLVDAGDAVQGTLYFTLFGGQVEKELMNRLGYDIQILGNHEFDPGMENLRNYASGVKATMLTTNYDFSDTPLDTLLRPYVIKEVGGRKVGFIGIGLDPEGIIFAGSSRGMKYLDGLKAANATAWHLKHNEKADMVIAVSHIGYSLDYGLSDVELASKTEDIDIIIGGHTHTAIDPDDANSVASRIVNLAGDTVLIAQAGYGGKKIGEITIDLGSLKARSRLIPIDKRLDDRLDSQTVAIIDRYRNRVDSMLAVKVVDIPQPLKKADWTLCNLIADVIEIEGERLSGRKIDMGIMNRGGLRCDLNGPVVTEGNIMEMMPFDNKIVVMEISGKDLGDAFAVMARRRGEAISKSAYAPISASGEGCREILIGGKPLDPGKTYTVATVDYLAAGGDYMAPLKNGEIIARSENILFKDIIKRLADFNAKKRKIKADSKQRMPLDK